MIRAILALALLLALPAVAQEDSPTRVVFADGSQVEVPEDHKVVFVRDDTPVACVEIDFLELIMPASKCAGLTVSPGCD